MHFIRAKLLLLSVALTWLALIIFMLPIQLPVTLLGGLNATTKRYRYGFWIAQDQMVNAIHGGNPDVTVSSKVGYMAEQGSKTAKAMAVVIDLLFKLAVNQDNHCQVSIERDEEHY